MSPVHKKSQRGHNIGNFSSLSQRATKKNNVCLMNLSANGEVVSSRGSFVENVR